MTRKRPSNRQFASGQIISLECTHIERREFNSRYNEISARELEHLKGMDGPEPVDDSNDSDRSETPDEQENYCQISVACPDKKIAEVSPTQKRARQNNTSITTTYPDPCLANFEESERLVNLTDQQKNKSIYIWNIINPLPKDIFEFYISVWSCFRPRDAKILYGLQEKQNIDNIAQQRKLIQDIKDELDSFFKLQVQECFLEHRFQKEEIQDTLDTRNALQGEVEKHTFEIERLEKSKGDTTERTEKCEADVNGCQTSLSQAEDKVSSTSQELEEINQKFVAMLQDIKQKVDAVPDKTKQILVAKLPFLSEDQLSFETPQQVKDVLDTALTVTESELQSSAAAIVEAEDDKNAKKEVADESQKQHRYAEKDWLQENFIRRAFEEEKYKDEYVKESCQTDYYKLIAFIKAEGNKDIRRLMHGHSALSLSFYAIKKTQCKNVVGPLSRHVSIKDGTPDLLIWLITSFFLSHNLLSVTLVVRRRDHNIMEKKLTEFSPGSYQDNNIVEYQEVDVEPEDVTDSVLSLLDFAPDANGDILRKYLIDKYRIDRIVVQREFVEPGIVLEHPSLFCNSGFYFTWTQKPNLKACYDRADPLDCDSQYRMVSLKHDNANKEKLKRRWDKKLNRLQTKAQSLLSVSESNNEACKEATLKVGELRSEEWPLRMTKEKLEEKLEHADKHHKEWASSYNSLKANLEESQSTVNSLREELDRHKAHLQSSQEQLERLNGVLGQKSVQRAQLQKEVDEINASTTFQDALKKIANLEKRLKDIKRINHEANTWIQEARRSVSLADVQAKLAEKPAVENRLREAKEELRKLNQRSTHPETVEDAVLFRYMGIPLDFEENFTPEEAAKHIVKLIGKMDAPCVFLDQYVEVNASKQVFVVNQAESDSSH